MATETNVEVNDGMTSMLGSISNTVHVLAMINLLSVGRRTLFNRVGMSSGVGAPKRARRFRWGNVMVGEMVFRR